MAQKSFIEVQFPIGPLSLESYIERLPYVGKVLNSLGKWWGTKPLVLTRAIILGAVFPASEHPERWPDDLDIFLKCLCLDNAGMWERKREPLAASLCWSHATADERAELFEETEEGNYRWRRGASRDMRQALEKQVFYTLGHTEQREYCCRVEEIDGPPEESWAGINAYLSTSAKSLPELIQELSVRRFGQRLKVGDAFCGIGSISFEAAELGCDVYASDLNPVACLLTWGALNIVGGTDEFRKRVHAEQARIYNEVDAWIREHGLEESEEGWRAEAYLYCVETEVPEWDGWCIPISPSWVIAPKLTTWVELVPIEPEKRFGFRVRNGGSGFNEAYEGTKQDQDIVCPQSLWDLFKRDGRHKSMPRTIPYNRLVGNAGGLRRWVKRDFLPRPGDVLQERFYCIRWQLPRLADLLDEEQSIRQKRGANLEALTRVEALIAGLLPFLNEREQVRLFKLRQRDWWREDVEILYLEKELESARAKKVSADEIKALRMQLRTCKANQGKRKTQVTMLSAKVPGLVYREPRTPDLDVEQKVVEMLDAVFDKWQQVGWIPSWRIEPGQETTRLVREKGWTYWHHLFTPRQLLTAGYYSQQIAECEPGVRAALVLAFGRVIEANARLTRWKPTDGGGVGGTVSVYYNQALNTLYNYASRSWAHLAYQAQPNHQGVDAGGIKKSVAVSDARETEAACNLWITDPPYADAVNYEELSEFFLAWYTPHLKAVFPDWYTDSMRARAVKGNDASFRVAMAECYRRLVEHMPDNGMQVLMFTHKSTDVWEDLALIIWAAGLQVKQVWSIATETPGAGIRTGNYVQATYNMVLRKRTGNKLGFIDFITPQVNQRVWEVIARLRESQVEGGLARCGYTDTDYLLAAQAAAAEVVTGYASIDGVDLEAELRTPNAERGRSALRTLMDNAKRTATDFLVPSAMDRAIKKAGGMDTYQFWREFCPEEKFLLKGLELEAQGVFKIGAFQDLGRAHGLSDYEALLGPTRANDTRTKLPEELPRPDSLRFEEIPPSERNLWRYSPTRHIYHALKLLHGAADIDRAVKHLVDSTDFWNLRTSRLAVILAYLKEMTAYLPHWEPYHDHLAALAIGVENWKA